MNKRQSGGGILMDQGIHLLDLMIMLSGGFVDVQAVVTNNFWKIDGIEDNVFMNLEGNNLSASLHSTMIEWRHTFSLEILLESGYLALNGLKTPSGSYGSETLTICGDKHEFATMKKSEILEYDNNNSWNKEMELFLNSINSGNSYTNIGQAKVVLNIIERIYKDTGYYKDYGAIT
jgi:predicted dehydrogenase